MIDADAKKVVEAVLFSSSDVLSGQNLATILGHSTPAQVATLIDSLNEEYERTNRTFRIVPVAGGFQMRTLPLYRTWVQKAAPLKPVRLTQPALETLAIVAYRQPVTRAEVEHLRGVDCSHALRALLERRLVRIAGKDKSPGRPILYGTTREFLSLFNLNDLRELPTLEELDLSPSAPAAEAAPRREAG
jgi:segregation and condensation protein B